MAKPKLSTTPGRQWSWPGDEQVEHSNYRAQRQLLLGTEVEKEQEEKLKKKNEQI